MATCGVQTQVVVDRCVLSKAQLTVAHSSLFIYLRSASHKLKLAELSHNLSTYPNCNCRSTLGVYVPLFRNHPVPAVTAENRTKINRRDSSKIINTHSYCTITEHAHRHTNTPRLNDPWIEAAELSASYLAHARCYRCKWFTCSCYLKPHNLIE